MANSTFEKINYQVGRLCRLGSRKAKLMAISNRRKQQLRHLGERIYIFKALQQDEDIWEKDEISQLLLTIADLDQEQEMLIDEINEIKAENPPEDLDPENQEESSVPDTKVNADQTLKTEAKTDKPKPEIKKAEKKVVVAAEKKEAPKAKPKSKPKTPRKKPAENKKPAGSTSKAKTAKKD